MTAVELAKEMINCSSSPRELLDSDRGKLAKLAATLYPPPPTDHLPLDGYQVVAQAHRQIVHNAINIIELLQVQDHFLFTFRGRYDGHR